MALQTTQNYMNKEKKNKCIWFLWSSLHACQGDVKHTLWGWVLTLIIQMCCIFYACVKFIYVMLCNSARAHNPPSAVSSPTSAPRENRKKNVWMRGFDVWHIKHFAHLIFGRNRKVMLKEPLSMWAELKFQSLKSKCRMVVKSNVKMMVLKFPSFTCPLWMCIDAENGHCKRKTNPKEFQFSVFPSNVRGFSWEKNKK